MKTLPPYAPKTPVECGTNYEVKVLNYGPAPKGYRWLKIGEKKQTGDIVCSAYDKKWTLTICAGDDIRNSSLVAARPVNVKRDSNGRFAPKTSAKALPDLGEGFKKHYTKNWHAVAWFKNNLASIDRVLKNPSDRGAIYGIFSWSDAAQGHNYWSDREAGKASLSPEDLDYLRAAKEFFEKRIAELTPAPKLPVNIGASMTKHILEDHTEEGLRRRIGKIEEVLAGNKSSLISVFIWSESAQGNGYWRERHDGRTPVREDDLDYLRAVKTFMEARVKELGRPILKAPEPVAPTVPELQSKITSLEAEVASLKRKVAGAKVTFPE